jgi:glycosyltransferase involved in cell wall biosynthesis
LPPSPYREKALHKLALSDAGSVAVWVRAAVTAVGHWVSDYGVSFIKPLAGVFLSLGARAIPATRFGTLSALTAARYLPSRFTFEPLTRATERLFGMSRRIVIEGGRAPGPMELKRVLVLKEPVTTNGRLEKGVVLVKFTGTFAPLYSALQGKEFFSRYRVVLEPSWSGYALADILCWFAANKGDVLVQTFDPRDKALFTQLGLKSSMVEVGPGSWADYRTFDVDPAARKEYAVIYVANYARVKRLHVFMRLVRQLSRSGHRCALICSTFGGDRRPVVRLAQYYGASRAVDIYEDLTQAQVNYLLNRSRVSVLLSRKEGMNRGVSESLFAGVPVVVLKENVGNHSCINKHTGVISSEKDLYASVKRLIDLSPSLRTREWALKNISPEATTRILEARLTAIAQEAGEPWTTPLQVKVNAPEARYLSGPEAPSFEAILQSLAVNRG